MEEEADEGAVDGARERFDTGVGVAEAEAVARGWVGGRVLLRLGPAMGVDEPPLQPLSLSEVGVESTGEGDSTETKSAVESFTVEERLLRRGVGSLPFLSTRLAVIGSGIGGVDIDFPFPFPFPLPWVVTGTGIERIDADSPVPPVPAVPPVEEERMEAEDEDGWIELA